MARRKRPPAQDATRRNPTIAVVRRREGSQILHTAPDDGRFGGLDPGLLNRSCLAPCSASSRLSSSIVALRGTLASAILSSRPEVIRRTPRLRLHLSSLRRPMLTRIGPITASPISNAVAARCGAKIHSRLCGSDATSPIWRVSGFAGPWREIVPGTPIPPASAAARVPGAKRA